MSKQMELSAELYPLFRDILLNRAGLYYPERKRDDLAYGLSHAAHAAGLPDLPALYTDITNGGPSWDTVLEHLTVGETYFFRNAPQFAALRRQVLPELIQRQAKLRSLRLWSAGCATGEEPYSLAMTINDMLPDEATWQVTILATDLNAGFLDRARAALYSNWSFRETPEELRSRYFTPEENRWRLRAEIRRRVIFARLNLVEDMFPAVISGTCALDLIFCRNVMIYFDEATIRRVVDRLYRALSPGGWLFVGHAEPQASVYHQFEVHNFPNTVVYRKPLDAPMFAFDSARGVFDAGANPILDPQFQQSDRIVPRPTVKIQDRVPVLPAPIVTPPATLPAPQRTVPPLPAPEQPAPSGPAAHAPQSSATSRPPTGLSQQLQQRITTHLAQGNRAAAETLLRELLDATPDHVEARTRLGRLYADRGEWDAAREQCEQALAHNPLTTEAHFILAQIYEHEGQLEAALAAYRRTVYLDRTFVAGMVGMANVWRQMGRVNDALRVYRNVLKQLASHDARTAIPGLDGTTAGEIVALVTHQVQTMTAS
jgi:chemotaxis protein methyltransferase CheR